MTVQSLLHRDGAYSNTLSTASLDQNGGRSGSRTVVGVCARPGELLARLRARDLARRRVDWRRTSRPRSTGCLSRSNDRNPGLGDLLSRPESPCINHWDLALALINGTEPILCGRTCWVSRLTVRVQCSPVGCACDWAARVGAAAEMGLGVGLRDVVLSERAAGRGRAFDRQASTPASPNGTAAVRFGGPRGPRDQTRPGQAGGRVSVGRASHGGPGWPARRGAARGAPPAAAAGPSSRWPSGGPHGGAALRCRPGPPRPHSSAGRTPSACTRTPGPSTPRT